MKQLRTKGRLITCGIILLFLLVVHCEPEWAITENDTKYLIENKYQYTWFEAVHECAKRNLSLVAIDTSEKNFHLVNLLKNRFGRGLDLWIGGTESTAEKSQRKFVWASNGKAFNFASWEQGEPNNLDGNQPCVHMWSKTNNFTWADGQWHLKYGYICEETFTSKHRQIMAKKRQAIQELEENLLQYFKKKQKQINRINEAQDSLLQQINIEIEAKLESTKILIDRLLEEM